MNRRSYVGYSGKAVAVLLVLAVTLGFTGMTYGHWQDMLFLGGTINTASGFYQKTFVLTVTCNNPWLGLTYYGALEPDGSTTWASVQLKTGPGAEPTSPGVEPLAPQPNCGCSDKVVTGVITGLSNGQYNWKIYTSYGGAQVIVGQGSEQISRNVTNSYTFGVTSLEVVKTVTSVQLMNDGRYKISGTIKIENDNENYAVIMLVNDTIQYKAGYDWEPLKPDVFVVTPVSLIAPGVTVTLSYYAIFDSSKANSPAPGEATLLCPVPTPSWRNLAEVILFNHPDGIHTFHYTADFTLP